MRTLAVHAEAWPMRGGSFRISRGARTEAETVMVVLQDGDALGRGECVPYPRYDETVESVVAQIESVRSQIEAGMTCDGIQSALPPGAARNALDCALWDLAAKQAGKPAWSLLGLTAPAACVTAMTLSLDSPENMGAAARRLAHLPLLKLKVAGGGDLARVRAVRENAPEARLIVDANEGWGEAELAEMPQQLAALGVELIEQPVPAAKDEVLQGFETPVPFCADESCHTRADLGRLEGRYSHVNVKLDKAGGLTEAAALMRDAGARGFGLMLGCMIGTSLAMAPALLLAAQADYVDLDGPLLLAKDREPGLAYHDTLVEPPSPALWG